VVVIFDVRAALLFGVLAIGCASSPPPALPRGVFIGSDGASHELETMRAGAKALVVTFFSPSCPCQAAHDERLRALASAYAPRGVRFVAIDAEVDATPDRDREEAKRRGYSFPILTDAKGALADALGADVATYSVVFDAEGHAKYQGGIDSDWTHPTPEAEPWLSDAIASVLRGDAPALGDRKAKGCALRRR
jgi:hypothetical protein